MMVNRMIPLIPWAEPLLVSGKNERVSDTSVGPGCISGTSIEKGTRAVTGSSVESGTHSLC